MSPLSAAPVGSSPQARGAQPQMGDLYARLGLIPAGAGSTVGLRAPARRWSAHPRRRGEHHQGHRHRPGHRGLIPAGAGSTPRIVGRPVTTGAHPRRRGEHAAALLGTDAEEGSSPQARGALHNNDDRRKNPRLIPAGAGSTRRPWTPRSSSAAHPRRRGEHKQLMSTASTAFGSSPQARGAQTRPGVARGLDRLIPAGAGSTEPHTTGLLLLGAHPRRRGEHIASSCSWVMGSGSSPQARGARPAPVLLPLHHGLIPAGAGSTQFQMLEIVERMWLIPAGAGSTTSMMCLVTMSPAHPRRRGEHCEQLHLDPGIYGSSPQARGAPAVHGTPIRG